MVSARRLLLLALVLLATTLSACFSVNPENGKLMCSSDKKRLCPDGFTCAQGFCYERPDLGEGYVEDGGF